MIPTNALTWVGLLVAAFGWVLLLFGVAPPPPDLSRFGISPRDLPPIANLHLTSIYESMILTGLALAVIGAIQEAADRLLAARETPPRISTPARAAEKQPSRMPPGGQVVERGQIGGRDYEVLSDRTVEVRTLAGLRRFTSLDEAAEFIGVRR